MVLVRFISRLFGILLRQFEVITVLKLVGSCYFLSFEPLADVSAVRSPAGTYGLLSDNFLLIMHCECSE